MNAGGGSSSYAIQPAWSARRSRSIETSRDASTTGRTESSTGWAIAAFDHNRAGTMGPWPSRRTPKLDAHKLRADFPVFEQPIHGKPLAFLDSAVTSQKPRQVLDAMREFYETSYSNVHRGVYTLSERATEGYEGAREKVRAFLNAPSTREVIFVAPGHRGAQPRRLRVGARQPRPGRRRRRHRARAPLELRARGSRSRGAPAPTSGCIPIDDQGELRMDLLDEVAGDGQVKVVAANLVSNSLGTINPIEKLAAWAHERGAIMVVDAAQAAPHRRIDVQTLGADFVAFSSHKMCGPTGVGVALGPPRAARGDVAVQLRRLDDPLGQGRGDALERAAVQVRGRHAGDRGGLRARDRDRLPRGGRARRDRASTSTSSPPTRWSGWPSSRS